MTFQMAVFGFAVLILETQIEEPIAIDSVLKTRTPCDSPAIAALSKTIAALNAARRVAAYRGAAFTF